VSVVNICCLSGLYICTYIKVYSSTHSHVSKYISICTKSMWVNVVGPSSIAARESERERERERERGRE